MPSSITEKEYTAFECKEGAYAVLENLNPNDPAKKVDGGSPAVESASLELVCKDLEVSTCVQKVRDVSEDHLAGLARGIGHGHAYQKHIVEEKQFPQISTRGEFTDLIFDAIMHPTLQAPCANGYVYWNAKHSIIVIENFNSKKGDGGTAYLANEEQFHRLAQVKKKQTRKVRKKKKSLEKHDLATMNLEERAVHLSELAYKIGHGHAFDKHVVEQLQFPKVTNPDEFTALVLSTVMRPSLEGPCSNGYMFWSHVNSMLVIENYNSKMGDGGTAFRAEDESQFHRLAQNIKKKKIKKSVTMPLSSIEVSVTKSTASLDQRANAGAPKSEE